MANLDALLVDLPQDNLRLGPQQLRGHIERLRETNAQVNAAARTMKLKQRIAIGCAIAFMVLVVIGVVSDMVVLTIVSFIVAIIAFAGMASFGVSYQSLTSSVGHISRASEILHLLAKDQHPDHKLRVDTDFYAHNASDKLYKTGRSTYGHAKSYYHNRWLNLRMFFAEGTWLKIRCEQRVKIKKGAWQGHKRRLVIEFSPNPLRYTPNRASTKHNRNKLREALQETLAKKFHNAPELLAIQAGSQEGTVRVKIMQDDTEILPDEVSNVVATIIEHLQQFRVSPTS